MRGQQEGREAMRIFSCFTHHRASTVPTLSFIFAADEARAKVLARRELREERDAVTLEVCENGKLLWTETV
jgi:hypothetical protein